MADKKDNYSDIPKCYREFYLSYTDNYEDSGFDKEYLEWLLNLLKNHPDDANLQDKDVQNNLGCIFENGIMVEKDIHKAVYWYERAISHGDDLAMSNLADILRKGSQGYPKNLERAFELYKRCGLPYAASFTSTVGEQKRTSTKPNATTDWRIGSAMRWL